MVLKIGAMHGPPKRKVGVAGPDDVGKCMNLLNVQVFLFLNMCYCRFFLVVYDG